MTTHEFKERWRGLLKFLLFFYLPALVVVADVARADVAVVNGATSKRLKVFVAQDTSPAGKTGLVYNTASLKCYYSEEGQNGATTFGLASSTLGTYTSGCLKEVDSSNLPGVYEFCPPDASLDGGIGTSVVFECSGASGMAPMVLRVNLSPPADVRSWGGNGVPGLYDGTIQSEAGAVYGLISGAVVADDQFNNGFQLVVYDSNGHIIARSCIIDSADSGDTVTTQEDISALIAPGQSYNVLADAGCAANVVRANGNSTAISNLKLFFDGTGYAGGTTKLSVDVGSMLAAVANKIADHVLRRSTSNVEASSDGDTLSRKSLYGAVARQTHRVKNDAGTFTIYKFDGTTSLSTQSVTTNASAPPITEISN